MSLTDWHDDSLTLGHCDAVTTDHRSGDIICRGCGEVLAERLVDDAPEWNMYEDSAGDPSRVGGALDDRNDRIFGTNKKKNNKRSRASFGGDDVDLGASKRTQSQKRLAGVCARLDNEVRLRQLPQAVKELGLEIADQAEQKGVFRGADETVMLGALLYLACKHSEVTMTLKDVAAYTGADKVEVGRMVTKITSKVVGLHFVVTPPEAVARKYAADLKVPDPLKSMIADMVERARHVDEVAKSVLPHTLAAAVLLLSCHVRSTEMAGSVPDHPVHSLNEVATISRMSEAVIKKAYNTIYQRKDDIVTPAFRELLAKKKLELVPVA